MKANKEYNLLFLNNVYFKHFSFFVGNYSIKDNYLLNFLILLSLIEVRHFIWMLLSVGYFYYYYLQDRHCENNQIP